MLERVTGWNGGDPHDKGDFDTEIAQAFVIPAGGQKDVDIDCSRMALIYSLKAACASANNYIVRIYSKTARAAADLIYTSGAQTGNFLEQNTAGSRLIVAVDKDKTEHIFMSVLGTSGDTVTVTSSVIRLT